MWVKGDFSDSGSKSIRRDYSNARTPQQNGVAERKNRTLIEAARTMLADSKLPTMFWTEAVSTACYVLNRVLVTKPHNKTPYELVSGKVPNISHLKPFGCLVTILNTSDHLGKFEGKADEGFIVGYAAHSKAYRVYNLSSKKIEETLNLRYLEDKPNVQGLGHEWYFDLDYLTDSLGYTRFKTNQPAGTQDTNIHAGTQDDSDSECDEQVIVVPSFPSNSFSGPKVHEASQMMESNSDYAEELARLQRQEHEAKDTAEKYGFSKDTEEHLRQADMVPAGSIDPAASITAGSIDPTASISTGTHEPFPTVIEPVHADETSLPPGHSLGSSEHSTRFPSPSDLANSISSSLEMEDIYHHPRTGIFSSSSYDADFGGTVTNLAPIIAVDPVPTKRVNTIHPQSQILIGKKSKFGASGLRIRDEFAMGEVNILSRLYNEVEPVGILIRQTNSHDSSPFVLEAYSDSDYAGLHGDRKSTTGGCQFLGRRLISWQCKKQTLCILPLKQTMLLALLTVVWLSVFSGRCEEFLTVALLVPMVEQFSLRLVCFSGGTMLPPAQAAIAGESSGEAAPSNPQIVHETITEPDHSHDHVSTPPRPTTTTSGAPVNEPGPSSDPTIASSSRPHEYAPDQFTSTNVEDETMGGSFQTSPPRSTQAPPKGTTLRGAEDLDKLTALSTLVSTLVQKVNTQESELNAHKLLFKEVVGKLVKKVKLLEDKLKGRKRKFVMTDSDKEEDAEQDVDPLIKLAKAAATAAAASAIPTGGSHEADIPPSSSVPTDEFAGGSDVPAGATTGPSADPSNKGKSPLMEEDPPVEEKATFRQREEDRLGEEAARRMYEEEQAELEREREEMQKKRQQDVLNSAKYYTDSDWTDIMGQVHANQGLTADLLGPDVTEDNFAERMVALIAKRRREFAVQRFKDKLNKPMTYAQQKAFMRTFVKNQSSTIYTTGWTMKHVKSFSDDQLKTEFDKIRTAAAELQSQNIRRSLKRPGADLEQASSKKSKSTEAPKSDVPADSQQPSVEVPSQKATIEDVEVPSNTASTTQHTGSSFKKVGTRKKRLGRKGVHPSHSTIPIEDGDPEAKHKLCIKYASDADSASDDDTPINLHVVVDWELLPMGTDLMIIYGRVMTFYQDKKAEGVGLVLWGDLKVLIDSPEVNDGSDVWKNQHTWIIQSWMLDHQLEICHDTVGNELTTAVQLIAFLKKQISDSRRPKVHDCPCFNAVFLVADSKFMKVAFGVGFKMLLFNPLVLSTKDLSRNLKLTMSNSSLGEDC
ncbi:putative ribonuclease H-like domain-containing protein [Tanacetum coccineum]